MNTWYKKLLKQYGPIFLIVFVVSFFALITLSSRIDFPTFPGDISIEVLGIRIYLPITSASAFSFFVIALIEMYRFMKKF